MLKRLITVIDEYVTNVGLIGLTGAVTSLLAFGGTLSALLGNTAIKAASIAAAIVGVLGLFTLLIAARKDATKTQHLDRRLLSRYCDIIVERLDPAWRVLFWEQKDVIDEDGNTKETITIHARVESKELYFFRLRLDSLSESLPDRLRRQVNVRVRNVVIDGIGGTRYDTSTNWLADGRIEVIAHFDAPAQQGSEAKFAIEVYWPRKCEILVKHREPEVFRIHFSRVIEFARYIVVLPRGEDSYYNPVGFSREESGYSIYRNQSNSGEIEVSFVARNVEADRLVGMRLDLR